MHYFAITNTQDLLYIKDVYNRLIDKNNDKVNKIILLILINKYNN